MRARQDAASGTPQVVLFGAPHGAVRRFYGVLDLARMRWIHYKAFSGTLIPCSCLKADRCSLGPCFCRWPPQASEEPSECAASTREEEKLHPGNGALACALVSVSKAKGLLQFWRIVPSALHCSPLGWPFQSAVVRRRVFLWEDWS